MDREAWRAAVHGVAELDLSDSKFSKAGFNNMRTVNFQMFRLVLEKVEEPEIKLPTSAGLLKQQESSRKTSAAPAAAKSHQSCPTLWDPIDGSPPGSTIPGILLLFP